MPWGRLDDSLYDHPKLDRIPLEHRLAAIGLWARSISWCNRYLTDGHVPRARVDRLDGSIHLADLLVSAGLFEDTSTGYLVHDFLEFNESRDTIVERRAKEAQRKADYRASKGKEPRPAGTTHGTRPAGEKPEKTRPNGTKGGTPRTNGTNVPPVVPTGQGEARNGVSQRDSRARNPDPTRPDPTRPDPTRPIESLERESRARAAGRADVAALRARGWPRVTKAQRGVLDEVANRHDATGYAFAAAVIEATPPDGDPLAAVMQADAQWQDAQRRRADAEEQAWAKDKAQEKADAAERMGDLGSWTP